MTQTENNNSLTFSAYGVMRTLSDETIQVIVGAGFEPDGFESWTKVLVDQEAGTRARIVICAIGQDAPLTLSGSVMDLRDTDLESLRLHWKLRPDPSLISKAIKRIETYFVGP